MSIGLHNKDTWIAGGLVVAALALGLSLVPTAAELGSHLNTDAEGTRARHYLEQALQERGAVRDVVIPLAKIRGEQGEPAAGLALLDSLGSAHWTAADRVLRRQLLRAAGRRYDLAQELEVLRRDTPTLAQLDELAQLYAEQQLYDQQAEVLDQSLALRPDDPDRVLAAAHLWSSIGERNRSLQLLAGLWQQRPEVFSPADFTLLANLTIDLDPTPTARVLIQGHYGRFHAGTPLLEFGRRFFAAGRLDDVVALLSPELRRDQVDRELVELWARTMILRGEADAAATTLRAQLAGNPDLSAVHTMLCEVALSHGDLDAALQIAERAGLAHLEGTALVWLASAAAGADRPAVVKRIVPLLTDDLLVSDPVGSANLNRVAGRSQEALRWVAVALDTPDLTESQQLWLAELCLDLGKPALAAVVLGRHLDAFGLQDSQAVRVAMLWHRAQAAPKALALLTGLKLSTELGVGAARALLLASAGRVDEALALMAPPTFVHQLLADEIARQDPESTQGRARRAVTDWLIALSDIALAQKQPKLAVFAYRQQLALYPGQRPVQWALAQAYLDIGQPQRAVETGQAIARPLEDDEPTRYRLLLLNAYRAKAPVEQDLAASTVSYLQGADLRQAEAESWVHLLLELKATRAALPFVARLAALKGGAWAARQVALLQELGATDEVLALWRQKGLDSRASRGDRVDAANGLLAAGDRATALRILEDVAASDPPDSDVVKQLIYLWGPRPGPAVVQWLAARARAAGPGAQVAWLQHLQWVGGWPEVVAIVGLEPDDAALLPLLIDGLVNTKRFKDMAALVERRIGSLGDPTSVQRLAEQCGAHGFKRAADLAWQRLLVLNPRHAGALRYLALLPATERVQAAQYWETFFQLPPQQAQGASWRDRVAYGDILLGLPGRKADGEQQLRLALQLLETATMPQADRDVESGRLLARLHRSEEAIAALARALEARPCDLSLRADLLALLLEVQRFDQAKALADPPERCQRPQ